jgi:hypothetical protein
VRGHAAFSAARHHEADGVGIGSRQITSEQRVARGRGKAPAEIVDEPVAFGLSENRDDAFRINATRIDCSLNARNVIGRGG